MAVKHAVIGLVAHVDAGKTTLSESMLYIAGALRRQGRVDHGDAFLDTDAQEKERGITIFSKMARLSYQDAELTLLDTPGHVDFSGETESALSVMDGAALVVSALDGVQSHTRTIWRLLDAYRVPVWIFVNKMDQPGADREKALAALRKELGGACVDMLAPGADEELALCGEDALNELLETGTIGDQTVAALIARRRLFPVYFGAALRNQGAADLLDGLTRFLPERAWGADFGARVYKIARDSNGTRLTFLKVTGGTLRVRAMLLTAADRQEKVNQLRLYSGARFQPAEEAPAGTLCAVTGLENTFAGQGLGAEPGAKGRLLFPVLAYRAVLPDGADAHKALQCFRELAEEDPQLNVVWLAQLRRIQVEVMGEVQLEVLARRLQDRFGLAATFTEGGVLYRETIADQVEGAGHYEPLRHYAEVHLLLEPGERGSGVTALSAVSEDDLALNWQRLILTHILEKQNAGVLTGAPLTDVRITLTAGRAHLKHTEGGDFRQATYRAIRQGLMQAKSVLLEPWYDVRLVVPQDQVGRALNDLTAMGGSAELTDTADGMAVVTGRAPVAKARHYAREVAAYTHGLGKLALTSAGYDPCAEQEAVVAASGYDPERDVENPADSVFCSHGAGVTVPWREAASRMHIQTGFGRVRATEAPEPVRRTGVEPKDALEEDRELMAIFERTYGPIKPRAILPRVVSSAAVKPTEIADAAEEFLLVDGYNVGFAWEELKQIARENLDYARKLLIDLMCNYQGMRPVRLILVFDAYRVAGNPGSVEKHGGITVVYTREAETADAYIEKAAYDLGKDRRVRVVSSDGMEQLIILSGGALRVSAREFHREVDGVRGEIARLIALNNVPSPSPAAAQAMRRAMQAKQDQDRKEGKAL
ncbi:MAG: NYN domain-containing protein [Clostridia bacterium]|nr:NYN domain-containing protein [Clostridia bacterium]